MFADIVTIGIWVVLGGAAIVLLYLTASVFFKSSRKRGGSAEFDPPTAIDIPALEDKGPPPGRPALEIYGTGVRLAVLVVAPVGREGRLPPREELPELMDALVPGLMSVIERHRPLFRRWPEQLSSQGFVQSFFNKMPLPGDRGKSTPWCSVAGRFESDGIQYLAGLVCCAERGNGLSEFTIEHAGQWLDIVRVQSS